jgi:hypothetical protein
MYAQQTLRSEMISIRKFQNKKTVTTLRSSNGFYILITKVCKIIAN